ncbi:MAG: putative flippase GtrA [Bradymonadia bacterium]|jgi:putative flippase GtrA
MSPLRALAHKLPPEQRRFIKFAIVGGSGVFVNLTIAAIAEKLLRHQHPDGSLVLPFFGEQPWATMASAIGIALGILVSIFTNFVVNDRWTWGDREKGGDGDWFRRCLRFYLTNGIAASLQFAVALFAYKLLGPSAAVVEGWLSQLPHLLQLSSQTLRTAGGSFIGIAVATPLNYVVNNLWTFKNRAE